MSNFILSSLSLNGTTAILFLFAEFERLNFATTAFTSTFTIPFESFVSSKISKDFIDPLVFSLIVEFKFLVKDAELPSLLVIVFSIVSKAD